MKVEPILQFKPDIRITMSWDEVVSFKRSLSLGVWSGPHGKAFNDLVTALEAHINQHGT